MTKSEAVKKAYDNLIQNAGRELDIYEHEIEELVDYLVDELGMLPPLHDLDNFPGMKDNGWES